MSASQQAAHSPNSHAIFLCRVKNTAGNDFLIPCGNQEKWESLTGRGLRVLISEELYAQGHLVSDIPGGKGNA